MGLDELRDEIRRTDEEIMLLSKKRLDLARQVGETKIAEGIPVRNRNVEKDVVSRYRRFAEENGMDPDKAEEICRALIQESVELQVSLSERVSGGKEISVIGGAGKMGLWFAGYFSSAGNRIKMIDHRVNNGLTLKDTASSDIVIIATPIPATENILRELDGICRPDALIFDIASLKTPFLALSKELATGRKICSIHPMFGPSARSFFERNLIICSCGNEEATKETVALFEDSGACIRTMDISSHDEYMAYVLGLSHAVNIAFFTVLERSGRSYEDMCTVASTTFRKNLETNESVASEDPKLYYDIQHLNSNSDVLWDEFSQAVEDIRKAALDDDPKVFIDLMERGNRYFSGTD